ncbi:MAG: hypothetical protein BWY21_00989 [Parcubacteria group bacterium ADurb.Bin216]|nr:MAG: hypothetical protein BWY21_00989 [Parcubacteria group bacterium ADurb.Bin216]
MCSLYLLNKLDALVEATNDIYDELVELSSALMQAKYIWDSNEIEQMELEYKKALEKKETAYAKYKEILDQLIEQA